MRANKLKIILLISLHLCFNITYLVGQTQTITGKIINAKSTEGLPFANVVLLNSSDSTFVTGGITDMSGDFVLNTTQSLNSKLLRIQYVGYEPVVRKVTSSNIGEIFLFPSESVLDEVQVVASTKTFRMENGRITADIQNSRLKDMGSLSDVLGQLPFVMKDQNNFTVFGKGAPVFYINNRLVRNELELQQISSMNIKKVTVITNPGAEYDSSVNSVIRIETVRPVGEGFSGELFSYNRYNNKLSILNNVSLNYRTGNFDIFGSFGYADMSFPKNRKITNTINKNDVSTTIIKTKSKENDVFRHHNPEIGFNYLINKNHSIGSKYQYYNQPRLSGNYSQGIEVVKDNLKESNLSAEKRYNGNNQSHYVNLYYDGFMNKWLTIKMDIDYKTTKNKNETTNNNLTDSGSVENIKTSNTASSDLYAVKLVLNTQIYNSNLVYGAEVSYTKNRQDSYVIENMGAPGIVPSNNDVKQNLVAGFLSFSRSFGQFSADIGLRFEDISSKYMQNGISVNEQSKSYQNLFPNLRLLYKSDRFQTEISYRKTIKKPSYSDLRSGIYYLAPYSYFSGNPLLQPSYQSSLTYMLMWKKFTLMTIYSVYKDYFEEMLPQLYLENSILLKPVNIKNSQQLLISLNYALTIGIWKPNIEIGMTKGFIKYGVPVSKYNKLLFSISFRNNIKLNDWQLGVDIYARTKGHRGIEYLEKNSWKTSLYANKSFLKNNLSVNVTANDIFNTTDDKLSIAAGDLSAYYDNSMYRRNIQLTISYRFNTSKDRYKGSKASDEIDRL